jgi:hypothetical protein
MENGAERQAVSMEGRKDEILTKRPAAGLAGRAQPAQTDGGLSFRRMTPAAVSEQSAN